MASTIFIMSTLRSFALGQYTASGTLSKFHPVIELSKLQSPESNTFAIKPYDVAEWFFHLQDGTYMQFQMNVESYHSELRQRLQMDTRRSGVWLDLKKWARKLLYRCQSRRWKNSHSFKCTAARSQLWESDGGRNLKVRVTLLSLLWGWNAEEEGEIEKYYLGQRNSTTTAYEVLVEDSKMSVSIGGITVRSMDASIWESYSCYFKAGVYIQHQSDESEIARTKFKELSWPSV